MAVNMRTLPTLGVSVAVVAALTGCGGSKLSGSSIEKLILKDLGSRGYAAAKVKCPDVDNKVDTKFTCDVTGAPDFTKIDGSVASGDKVNLVRTRK
jgi:hypothetical protein